MSDNRASSAKRITLREIARLKREGQKLVVVTAYDVLFARVVDDAGVDIVLVGDSVGNVVAGFDSTLPVKLDQMIYHGAAVRRGVKRALLVVDLPFLAYQASVERAILNAGRVMQETGADAVKMEGGSSEMVKTVAALTRIGIPVMAHLGFTPQSVRALGMRVQGREEGDADRLVNEASALEQAGAFSVVLELLPSDVAAQITAAVSIPTIGIGAGPHCDGQVLVLPDLLGLNDGFEPKFLKRYANLAETSREAVAKYADEVRSQVYPDAEHSN
ncbi:MAG TPA: 3-methyl-2-oxobutanoate hydroxymethyltransferase [Gemmatimonadaceae bacterium]|nr:3-methyl-2-oxobutanoate hydroxymethyltransferase [Gemmatimonadaceae bacterium]